MTIVISKGGKNAKKIDKSEFEAEDYLQNYIHQNPDSIPLYEVKEDVHLLILAREFPTESGPIDAIGVDRNGEIYLVETKLYKNADKRLVVAQVLDYGASLWKYYPDPQEFMALISENAAKNFSVKLSDKFKDFFALEDDDVSELIETIKTNLSKGNFKFVVLMDRLYPRLKDLIVYLNENSRFDFYAVELEYYKFNEYEIMIPKLFGSEVKKNLQGAGGSSSGRATWSEDLFFEDSKKKLDSKQVLVLKKLYEESKKMADEITWGTGVKKGTFNVKFNKVSVRSLYFVQSTGRLVLPFKWLHDSQTTLKYRDKFYEELKKVKGLPLPQDSLNKHVYLPYGSWAGHLDEILEAIRKVVT